MPDAQKMGNGEVRYMALLLKELGEEVHTERD
jgi:hypothetical protein